MSARTEDDALLARIARGDRSALEQLYRAHAPWLTARLDRRSPHRELVDSAVQDTFLAVWRSADRYRGDGEVAAWLWGIAVRRLVDQLRKKRLPVVDPTTRAEPAWDGFEADLVDQDGPWAAAVRRLEPDLRAVLVATALDGLTTRETAALLGIPAGTVKSRLSRARDRLRQVQP